MTFSTPKAWFYLKRQKARRAAAAGPDMTPWTPSAFGSALVSWLDASDDSQFTPSSGNVSSWQNRSITLSQSTSANRPGRSGNAVNFSGSTHQLQATGWPSVYDCVVSGKPYDASVYRALFWSQASAYPYMVNVTDQKAGYFAFGFRQFGSQAWLNAPGLMYLSYPITDGTPSGSRDGAAVSAGAITEFSKVNCVGNQGGGSGQNWGDIYEMVVVNRLMTTSEKQKTEGSLAWRRNSLGDASLVSALVSGHPYKSRPPLVTDP